MQLLPHQQRVVEEKDALDEKIDKLFAFTDHPHFRLIPEDERGRLHRQLDAMRTYSLILGERIEAFT